MDDKEREKHGVFKTPGPRPRYYVSSKFRGYLRRAFEDKLSISPIPANADKQSLLELEGIFNLRHVLDILDPVVINYSMLTKRMRNSADPRKEVGIFKLGTTIVCDMENFKVFYKSFEPSFE